MRREDLRPGPVRSINMSAIGDALTDPSLEPPVNALVCWNSNPARVAPDAGKVREGLRRDDLFCVVLEQFMTDTSRYADVVLPVTTQLEHLDAVGSWGHHYLTYNEPAIAPRGATKPNTEVFRLLAAALGFDDPCFRDTDDELLASALAMSPFVDAGALRERGWVKVDAGQAAAPHANGGFGTLDGKMSLLARYDPPAEVGDDALAARFPFALLTPKTHFFLNSTFANQSRQRTAQGEPFVAVHPDDAAPLAINDGQRVRVWNNRGSFEVAAKVTEDVRPGVLVAPMGWWARDHTDELGPQATTSQRLTDAGAAPTFNDNRVAIAPA
jgi:anaerobic selenocysteine-containing dehydrogenase